MNLFEQALEEELDTYEIWDNDIDSNEFFDVILPKIQNEISVSRFQIN